jgi:hypothetical protein
MSRICQTSVKRNGSFYACGRPTTDIVIVAGKLCHFCAEHAAAANRFNERRAKELEQAQAAKGESCLR